MFYRIGLTANSGSGWMEQRISNSSLTSCTSFHCFAQRCLRQVFGDSAFAVRCTGLHRFAAKFYPTVEQTVKRRASRARVRLFWWKAELRARRYRDDVRARAYAVAVKCAHPKVVSGICA